MMANALTKASRDGDMAESVAMEVAPCAGPMAAQRNALVGCA
jgi:hypothetical protein